MIVTVCSSGGGGGIAAQQAQRVEGFLDACVDSVKCLLEYVETGLEQGGLGCQRHIGSSRIGVFAMVMPWHHASFRGSSRESCETGVGADGHKSTVRWGHFPAVAACSRYREQDALHPITSTIRGAGASTCRNRFANDLPLRSTPVTQASPRPRTGPPDLLRFTPRKRPPACPRRLDEGHGGTLPEARGRVRPRWDDHRGRTACLFCGPWTALPQRRPNALITVW